MASWAGLSDFKITNRRWKTRQIKDAIDAQEQLIEALQAFKDRELEKNLKEQGIASYIGHALEAFHDGLDSLRIAERVMRG